MSRGDAEQWDERHRGRSPGAPEPFLVEMLAMLPRRGLALDVAAGRGRNALLLAQAGLRVVAADVSRVGLDILAETARANRLAVWPVVMDFDNVALRAESFDAIVNVNFLLRPLFAQFSRLLKPKGILVVDTFLVDQAELSHPRDPRFLLGHYELRELVAEMELLCYREGLVTYPDATRAWRAQAVARRRGC
jgi:tellurite methyltransferase